MFPRSFHIQKKLFIWKMVRLLSSEETENILSKALKASRILLSLKNLHWKPSNLKKAGTITTCRKKFLSNRARSMMRFADTFSPTALCICEELKKCSKHSQKLAGLLLLDAGRLGSPVS